MSAQTWTVAALIGVPTLVGFLVAHGLDWCARRWSW